MMCRGYYLCLSLVIILLQKCANAAPVSDSTDVGERLAGQFLLDLGSNNSSPLLRMLGHIFMNYEGDVKDVEDRLCQLHPCTEWGSWTKCPVTLKGQFSMMTRSRDCHRNDSMCDNKLASFRKGSQGEFFKTAMAQYDAQAACETDGGHLVNIDTKAKSDAIHAVLKSHGITSDTTWINGNRTQPGGAWQYTYGSVPDFENWISGQPTNGSTKLCKIETGSNRQWVDFAC